MDCGEMQGEAGAWGPAVVHALHVESTEPGRLCQEPVLVNAPLRGPPPEKCGPWGAGEGLQAEDPASAKAFNRWGCWHPGVGVVGVGWGLTGTLNLQALALGWLHVRCEGRVRGVLGGVPGLPCGCWVAGPETGTQEKCRQRRWPGGGYFPGGLSWGSSPTSPSDPRGPALCAVCGVRWGWAPADITSMRAPRAGYS